MSGEACGSGELAEEGKGKIGERSKTGAMNNKRKWNVIKGERR